jgi:hypothetical protein
MHAANASGNEVVITTGVPAIDDRLRSLLGGGVTFTLLSCPFSTPLTFQGEVAASVSPSGASATLTGRAALGAPFDLSAEVAVIVDASGGWLVELTLPNVEPIFERAMSQVSDGSARQLYRDVIKPYVREFKGATVAIASVDAEDLAGREVFGGINFYATFSPFRVQPLKSLAKTFEKAVRLDALTTEVHLACKNATPGFSFYVAALLSPDLAFGTPALVLDELALAIDQSTADLTAGASCRFTLRLDGEALRLRGGFTVDARGEARLSLALDAADGAWHDPFGLRGVTLGGFGVEVGAGVQFPWLIVGARGEAMLGAAKKPLADAELGLLLDFAAPEHCVVSARSAKGADLPTLAKALLSPTFGPPADRLQALEISLSDLVLELSPRGGTIAGKTYPAGLQAGGKIDLWGWGAEIGGAFEWEGGFALRGSMDPVDVGNWLQIGGAKGKRAEVSVECTAAEQGASASVRVALLGAASAVTRVELTDTRRLSIALGAEGPSVYAGARVELEGARVEASGKAKFSYPFSCLGRSVKVAMSAAIDLAVDPKGATVSESIVFTAHVDGQAISLHAKGSGKPLGTTKDIEQHFKKVLASGTKEALDFFKKVSDALAKVLWGAFFSAIPATATALESLAAAAYAGLLQAGGASMESIVVWTTDAYQHVSPERVLGQLHATEEQAVYILTHHFGRTASQAKKEWKKFSDSMSDGVDQIAGWLGI